MADGKDGGSRDVFAGHNQGVCNPYAPLHPLGVIPGSSVQQITSMSVNNRAHRASRQNGLLHTASLCDGNRLHSRCEKLMPDHSNNFAPLHETAPNAAP